MELTTKVTHPRFPEFVTEIAYMGRAESVRRMRKLEKQKRPYVTLDPRTDAPYLTPERKDANGKVTDPGGEPLIIWRLETTDDYASESIMGYVRGWSGLVLHGEDIPFAAGNAESLMDEELDIDGRSYSSYLGDKAADRKTFDADPTVNGSATP